MIQQCPVSWAWGLVLVLSFLVLSLANAAEPEAYWSTELESLGHTGLLAGEFDGHSGLDIVATFQNGDTLGLAVKLSGASESWSLMPATSESSMQLRSGQWDSDPELEVLVGIPGHLTEAGQVGGAWVLDFSGRTTAPDILEDLQVFSTVGTEPGTGFGTDLQLLECNEADGIELIVSEPGASERASPSVWAYSQAEDGASVVGSWQIKADGNPALGLSLLAFEQAESSTLAVAACEDSYQEGQICENKGVLILLPADLCSGTMSVNIQSAAATKLPRTPQALHLFIEGSTDILNGIVWAAPEKKSMVDLSNGTKQALTSIGDSGSFVQNLSESVPQSWIASSGSVWQLPGILEKGSVESEEVREHVLTADSLGQRLAVAGDVDGDGCDDVLSTSTVGQSLYLLRGCDPLSPDTGDTGTEDTGTKPEDTGDSPEPEDTGLPCESTFGWGCASVGTRRLNGFGLVFFSLIFWTRRQRKSA
jgi:hypothetical protein